MPEDKVFYLLGGGGTVCDVATVVTFLGVEVLQESLMPLWQQRCIVQGRECLCLLYADDAMWLAEKLNDRPYVAARSMNLHFHISRTKVVSFDGLMG